MLLNTIEDKIGEIIYCVYTRGRVCAGIILRGSTQCRSNRKKVCYLHSSDDILLGFATDYQPNFSSATFRTKQAPPGPKLHACGTTITI